MSVQINKDITTVQVEIPKTNVAIENAVTEITVQTSQPQLTIGMAGVSGMDGTSGTSGLTQDLSNYALLSGSNNFFGEQTISGSLSILEESEFGGNLVPKTPSGATLGTPERPFRDIYIQSASINIASDIIGEPGTSISNLGGNLLISAGGMRLLGSASFIATTGSFEYLSGSFTHIGLQFNEGDIVTTGSLKVSGSTIQIGNNTQIGNNILSGSTTQIGNNILTGTTTLTGSVSISGSTTIIGTTNFSDSSTTITGSLLISGSTTQLGNNLLIGSTNLSGSVDISGSLDVFGHINFSNCSTIITGSLLISGSTTQIGNNNLTGTTVLTGSLTLSSGSALNINDGFYVNGNKQFNHGQFYTTYTQSGSADTAYPMEFNESDNSTGITITNNINGLPTRITAVNTGYYNIQFSSQLGTTSTETCEFSIWLRKMGSDVTNSNGDITINKVAGGGNVIAAWNFAIPLDAGQYVELYYSKTTNNGVIAYKAPQTNPTRPATPSTILTVTQIA
jgi:hypothetical protein